MSENYEYKDKRGVMRRCGLLPNPVGYVCASKYIEDVPGFEVKSDKDLKRQVTDPERPTIRQLFPAAKYIRDQHSTSACNGWGWSNGGTKARVLRGIKDGLVMSGAYTYSKINGGRDRGSVIGEGRSAVERHGFCPEDLVKWDQIFPNMYPKKADQEAAKHKGIETYAIRTFQALKTLLANREQVVGAVMCGPIFDRFRNKMPGVQPGPGNHAINFCDLVWSGNQLRMFADNSWGVDYGIEGAMELVWDHIAETFKNHEFSVIRSTEEMT